MTSHLHRTPSDPEPGAAWRRAAPDVVATLGVRYATPRRARRFAPPVAVDPGAPGAQLDVASLAEVPVFPQLASRFDALLGPAAARQPQDERALLLNVWAPDGAEPGSLPVLVFLHGGGWTTGGASLPWYDGTRLAARGVVVVTIGYRIGPLGHLCRDDEGRPALTPLDDLRLGLAWVREHIGPLGGDAARVTLAGQSAGAWYAHVLATSPEDAGSFARVALLSPSSRAPWDVRRFDAVERAVTLAIPGGAVPHFAGTGPTTGFLAAMDVPSLLDAGAQAFARDPKPFGVVPTTWGPVADDRVAADLFDPAASAARFHPDAALLRFTAHETASFFGPDSPERGASGAEVERWLASVPGDEREPATGPWAASPDAGPFERVLATSSWRQFVGAHQLIADALEQRGVPVHRSRFTQGAPILHGHAGHGVDLPYQFGIRASWPDAGVLAGVPDDEYERVAETTIDELVGFVTG